MTHQEDEQDQAELEVVRGSYRSTHRGDFDARVEGGLLVVPEVLWQLAVQQDARTASALLAVIEFAPSELSSRLGWTVPEVKQATRDLKEQLRTHVSWLCEQGPTFDPPLGALPPVRPARDRHAE